MDPRDKSHHLGDLQHAIMCVLWDHGEASVAQVHELLAPTPHARALTTVATMLTKMERKGVVTHRSEGRQFVYRATVSRREVKRSMVDELTRRLFGGSATSLVAHLLEEQEIDPSDLDRLRDLIAEREAGTAQAGGSDSGSDSRSKLGGTDASRDPRDRRAGA